MYLELQPLEEQEHECVAHIHINTVKISEDKETVSF